MNRTIKTAALALATVAVGSATILAASQTGVSHSPAFDAGTRVGTAAPSEPTEPTTEPARRITGTSTPTGMLPFGFNPGDCPQEDNCRPDYDGKLDRWVIVPVIP
jgi:hypothetical protein